MLPTKFWLSLTYHSGADVCGFSRWSPILAILNLYVTPMPTFRFGLNPHYGLGADVFWVIQDGPNSGHLECWNTAVLDFHVSPISPAEFQLNPTYRSREDVVSRFSSRPPWRQSCILEWKQLAILPCYLNASRKDWLNPTCRSGADMVWRFSRWPSWRPSWISERIDFSNS